MHRFLYRLVACILLAVPMLHAQSYRGVQVGQRADLLPPEFNEVKRGEYDASFGTEAMQVFVNGALVTGFTVLPRIPLTLAEAVARHGSTPDVDKMFALMDPDGDPQGLVDPIKRISYVTRALGPAGIVSSVGYYDQNTALLIWTENVDPAVLAVLAAAAKNVSLQDLEARPRLATLAAKAQFMMEQALKQARADAQEFTTLFNRYQQGCSGGPVTNECQNAKRTLGPALMQAGERFRYAVKRAADTYAANAVYFNRRMPPELPQLQQLADRLLPQVPVVLPGQQ